MEEKIGGENPNRMIPVRCINLKFNVSLVVSLSSPRPRSRELSCVEFVSAVV